MKRLTSLLAISIATLCLALPTFAQAPPNASSLAPPRIAPRTRPIKLMASVNGGPYTPTNQSCNVGDVVSFQLAGANHARLGATIQVTVNDVPLTFPVGSPLAFTADQTGVWTVQLATPGFTSNPITITVQ